MSETQVKCKYFNCGHCKYKDKCRFLHQSEGCQQICQLIRICRYKTKCKHKEKCQYKHPKNNASSEYTDQNILFGTSSRELLDYKVKSTSKIESLENEHKYVKSELFNIVNV